MEIIYRKFNEDEKYITISSRGGFYLFIAKFMIELNELKAKKSKNYIPIGNIKEQFLNDILLIRFHTRRIKIGKTYENN